MQRSIEEATSVSIEASEQSRRLLAVYLEALGVLRLHAL